MPRRRLLPPYRKLPLTSTFAKAATPVGLVADGAQLVLELSGHKKAGKAVGATGNMASAAMTGFVIGGPKDRSGSRVWALGRRRVHWEASGKAVQLVKKTRSKKVKN